MTPADVTLALITEADLPVLRDLAGAIWRQHYTGIIPAAQIEFMLMARFDDESLREQLRAKDRWLELLRVSGTPVGYCSCELTDAESGKTGPSALKLGQLYVLESHRRRGLGGIMLRHVDRRARVLGSSTLWLQVNKRNTGAIGFYRAAGFEVIREAVFDIGGGFVMDDYVMAKQVAAGS